MQFSKFEENQMKLNLENLSKAKADYLEASISCILVYSLEPDKSKDYIKWENWKTKDKPRAEKNLRKALNNLSKWVIREKTFREICYEEAHNEPLPKENLRK